MTTTEAGTNHIVLVGRLSALDAERELPSGDRVRSFRVAVRRPPRADGPARSDAITCACWTDPLRVVAGGLTPGDRIRVEGALRRSFSRRAGTPQTFYEVEVAALTVLDPAPGPIATGPDPVASPRL